MSILSNFLEANKPLGAIEDGIYRARLIKHETCTKTTDKGVVIQKDVFLTFTLHNEEGKVVGRKELAYWKPDNSDTDRALTSVIKKFQSLDRLATLITGETEESFIEDYDSTDELKAEFTDSKKYETISSSVYQEFDDRVEDLVGDSCPYVWAKCFTNKSLYQEISADFSEYIEGEKPTMKLASLEISRRNQRVEAAKPEEKSKKPEDKVAGKKLSTGDMRAAMNSLK